MNPGGTKFLTMGGIDYGRESMPIYSVAFRLAFFITTYMGYEFFPQIVYILV